MRKKKVMGMEIDAPDDHNNEENEEIRSRPCVPVEGTMWGNCPLKSGLIWF